MKVLVAIALVLGCGSSASAPDAPVFDAPGVDAARDAIDAPLADDGAPVAPMLMSKFPRGSETFVALSSGDHVPLISGFQGFHLIEVQFRVPDSVTDAMPGLTLQYAVIGLGGTMESATLTLSAPSGGTRDSGRFVIYMNQFTDQQLSGASCHVTATLDHHSEIAPVDVTVTLDPSPCVDNGTTVVCPDGGVP